ncbi:hypothetical protein D9758_003348 [Tetrapyrgos nigripes]|uniref:Uncharacterized protein n=1 Tax=Tetrapyrgos nigripes TaxID=182062 RepID=A0A8H5GJ73_9AGAR|nr:hypothetical protein D9758_003348 [Tetrapyrgos nigripes]
MEMEDAVLPSSRRRPSKRVLPVNSDDEEEDIDISPSKRPRIEEDNLLDFDDDAGLEDTTSAGPNLQASTISRSKKPSKKAAVSRPRKAATPEDSEEEDYAAEDDDIAAELDGIGNDDDDDFVEEVERKRPAKGKGTAKGKNAKGGKGSKAKADEPKEIMIKDERQGSSSKRIIVDDNVSTPVKETEDASIPKKKKLPSIKKNKPPGVNTGSTTATNPKSASSTAKAPVDGISLTPSNPAVRVPPASVSTDFDLRDKNVYAMLLGGSGGSSSASGTKREKEEQRRKELNKLRDEAKAKRAMEAKDSFDLQAGVDKILRFEERLRRANSAVLYPNILGGKMKEVWEHERRRRDMEAAKREFEANHEEGEMLV